MKKKPENSKYSSTSQNLFGTDGVRGMANKAPITADIVLRIAQAVGQEFLRDLAHHTVVIGKDTRLSGYMIEPALTAGFISIGMDVVLVGPMPTSAISMLTRTLRADLGVMITASHNPYKDNGLKFFGPDGHKLPDHIEARIEENFAEGPQKALAAPSRLGRARRLDDAQGRYIEFVKNTFPKGLRLDGLRIVVDCAHGAGYKVAPSVFWELGADVIAIGDTPDGCNINKDCGATMPDKLIQTVKEHNADIGIALDGDADRLILVDEIGSIIDGDKILAAIATSWKNQGKLKSNALVATVMSNMGLEKYLHSQGIKMFRSKVGDRYVCSEMRAEGLNLGGEQSGHIICGDYTTTGDGLIAALQVLAVLVDSDKPARSINKIYDPLPQILESVPIDDKTILDSSVFQSVVRECEDSLANEGRILIRPSGTEPLLRIMVEGENTSLLKSTINKIKQALLQSEQKVA
ncbi:MAG: phosphoglucosamine mutase [Alphaproteobacteria bacterium]|jgi:phosphoglucosamine mutase|nr:phosphoglucosamine mutase [Alphaproteobacteria bacterium]MBT5390147.1 phosphoglucosamine mutase [Alphaproteobacteria bacterium]MBT5654767.1 phosphoglucosamine mutase [Alphaproteobacteria bacterium]